MTFMGLVFEGPLPNVGWFFHYLPHFKTKGMHCISYDFLKERVQKDFSDMHRFNI